MSAVVNRKVKNVKCRVGKIIGSYFKVSKETH